MTKSKAQNAMKFFVDLSVTPIRILHVDDETSLLKVAKQCLEIEGPFHVDIARSVKEAEKKMKSEDYDIIVSDYMMPRKTGLDFLRQLRDDGNSVPFIMFTGRGREEVAIKALNLGADQYVNKSGNPEIVFGELAYSITRAIERKRAEEELKKSEERYRALLEEIPIGICNLDLRGKLMYANNAFEKITGYSENEIFGKSALDLATQILNLHGQQLRPLTNRIQERLAGKRKSEPMIIHLKRKDGDFRWVEAESKLIKKAGKPVGLQAILKDVSERKRRKKHIRKNEERSIRTYSEDLLDQIFQCALDAYYLVDLNWILVDCNKTAEKLTGFDKTELIGRNFLKMNLLSRREISRVTKLLRKNPIGKPTGPEEFTLNHKDGMQTSVDIKTFPIDIQQRALVLVIARDITERKNAEKEIFESREKFRRFFMENPEAAIYVDSNFHILEANPRFTELFGYTSTEVINRHVNDLVVPPDSIQEAKMLDKKSKQGYIYHNTIRKRKDGALIPVAISAAPLIVGNELIGHIALYKDISKLKQTERALRDTLEKLRVVGGLTRHDVQNKLSIIAGNVHLAKTEISQKDRVKECLEDCELAIKQAEEIFDFARDYEKLGVEQLTCIDVGKSIDEAVSLIKDLHCVELMNDCQGLVVMADSLLRQLFYNLIDNSMKHGKKVSQIRIYYERMKDGRLKLIYEDNGIGVSAKEKRQIFREGYGKGTGYGLYLTKRVCEVYGWTLEEAGESGKGARFIMTMPFESVDERELIAFSNFKHPRKREALHSL
ncbi:MAG: PAS domain S-box protein [Candidatus Bathyarchaeota archaeon]|nr:MAG: PAS domain S-box protein [Candidatus Bathyarchaeota archaeon]